MKSLKIGIYILFGTLSCYAQGEKPSREINIKEGMHITIEREREHHPSGSQVGERNNRTPNSTPSTPQSIPVIPYVLTNETATHLQEIQRLINQISWIKGLLAGNFLLGFFTNSFREIGPDQFLKIKSGDWTDAATAFSNLSKIQYDQIQQTVDFAILDLDRISRDEAAAGIRSERTQQERKFWNDFEKNLPLYNKYGESFDSTNKLYLFIDGQISTTTRYNTTEDGVLGMSIFPQFSITNGANVEAEVAAYFSQQDGQPLKDFNQKYYTSEGQVAVSKKIMGCCKTSMPTQDFHLFIPYSELHLNPNLRYYLKFYVAVIGYGETLAQSPSYNFTIQ
jgi:hypothetical protein